VATGRERFQRRLFALTALMLWGASLAAVVGSAVQTFPHGLVATGLLVVAFLAAWEAVRRLGSARLVFAVVGSILLVAAAAVAVSGDVVIGALVTAALFGLGVVLGRHAFRVHVFLPPAPPPGRPVVVWNPRSGGGKAAAAHLDEEARGRGIEPIELHPGDDIIELAESAISRGADALAAAGGDGTQALLATIAAAHNLPFACIPAGTRNHFALDLGVDRDDVVGALDAFVSGGERLVDLAEVNGRVFVNNVSLGVYAEAVQRPEYRGHKLRTFLQTVPEIAGPDPASGHDMRFEGPGAPGGRPIVIQVSNNPYRLGKLVGGGTRPRLDGGRLGVVVLQEAPGGQLSWREWQAESFEVDADVPVPAGVDGEALVLPPPLRFCIRPGALRVRLAPQHPGASPSARLPPNFFVAVGGLLRIVRTGRLDPGAPTSIEDSGPRTG
jgi:diacylglycerol kinase family enzyme